MTTELPGKVLPPESPGPNGTGRQSLIRPHYSKRRLLLALTIAVVADGLSIFLTLTPPAQWAADLVTAILLFMVLGWQWILLPGLIMEAIPGLGVVPFWVLVVGAVALWGTPRVKLRALMPFSKAAPLDAEAKALKAAER
jgi:hypothetical protein